MKYNKNHKQELFIELAAWIIIFALFAFLLGFFSSHGA